MKDHKVEHANYTFLFLLKVPKKADPTDSTLKTVPQILQELIGDGSGEKGREGGSPSALINGLVLTNGDEDQQQQKGRGKSLCLPQVEEYY